jgi:hypothetical protein
MEVIGRIFEGVPSDEVEATTSSNVIDLYDIDRDKLPKA